LRETTAGLGWLACLPGNEPLAIMVADRADLVRRRFFNAEENRLVMMIIIIMAFTIAPVILRLS
jgi:hypothetical protein